MSNANDIRVPFSDLGAQYKQIESEVALPLVNLIESGKYIGGEAISKFENEFASYTGADFCVGVGNGTDALEILLAAAELPLGSTVLVPDNSFVATAEAVLNLGFKLRLVDVDENAEMNHSSVIENLDSTVSAVIAVHLFGRPHDLGFLARLEKEHGFAVFEDCAQAHGARFSCGRHVGTSGLGAAFSFYPGKNLGAIGDAGAVITNDKRLEERIRRIANHGRLEKYDHHVVGRNSRLDTIQALVLSAKLERLDKWVNLRRRNASKYHERLYGCPVVLPTDEIAHSAFHLFVIQTPQRDALKQFLANHGIETGIHYPKAISDYEIYSEHALSKRRLASELATKSLSLPVGEHLTEHDISYVCDMIEEFFSHGLG